MNRRKHRSTVDTFLAIILVASNSNSVLASPTEPAEASEVPVICPAIQQDETPRMDGPDEAFGPIELVVVGIAKKIDKQGPESDKVFEITVNRVLFGWLTGNAIRFTSYGEMPEGKEAVFALAPSMFPSKVRYQVKYTLPANEAESQIAMSDARLDFRVLSATRVFIGSVLATTDKDWATIRISKVLLGQEMKPGQELPIDTRTYCTLSGKVSPAPQEQAIFLANARQKNLKHAELSYSLTGRLPAELESAVIASLGRRDRHPMIEEKRDDALTRCREVMFQGSTSQAIALLDSLNEAAATLGARKLIHDRNTATPEIVGAIEKDLFKQVDETGCTFRRLENLIRLLPMIGQGTAKGEASRLTDKYLAYLASNPKEPPQASSQPGSCYWPYWPYQYQQKTANHALTWLLSAMDPTMLIEHYGPRVLRLRDTAKGRWREEIQMALDTCRVEDTIEVKTAMARMKGVTSVKSKQAMKAEGHTVAFSPDGRYLAVDLGVWDTSRWTPAGGLKLDGSLEGVIFSHDGNLLYAAGGGHGLGIHARVDWRSGKLERSFKGHKAGLFYLALTPDEKTMVTASYFENVVYVWDISSGRIVQSFDLPEHCFHLTLSPDGKTLVRQTGANELTIAPLTGEHDEKLLLPPEEMFGEQYSPEMNEIQFSPDGRSLICSTLGFAPEGKAERVINLLVYELATPPRLVSKKTLSAERCTAMAVSPTGNLLAVGDQKSCVWALSLPELKVLKQVQAIPSMGGGVDRGGLAFSPDGTLLAIGSHSDSVRLFRTDTLEPVSTSPGHEGRIERLFFSADGKHIRTVGADQQVCQWDASKLTVLKRSRLPHGYKMMSARGDGKYIACFEATAEEKAMRQGQEQTTVVKVIEADTGAVVSKPKLPIGQYRTSVHWISNHETLVATWTRLCRFDYLTGEVLQNISIDNSGLGNGLGELTEDGKNILIVEGGGKSVMVSVENVDIQTGESTKTGEKKLHHFTGNARGLVPGGRYFYIADPGMYIFDRKTLKLIAEKSFHDLDLLRIAFSPDGNRFAVVAGGRIFIDGNLRKWDPQTQSIIRVHDTKTAKTLFAFPTSTRWIPDLKFSPDNKRLAAANEDGTLEVWDLPE